MSACNRETDAIVIDEALMAPTNGSNELDLRAETYDNAAFSDIDTEGASSIEGQWPTGIADPFIMRWNGMYYLYCTTSGLSNHGLRAWKSADLVHWEKCRGEGLEEGYVVSPTDEGERYTQNAYAPEVFYFNGLFYMFISPGPSAQQRGHHVLTASHPEGPFEYYAGPLDTRIDGSLFIDDDETMYFLHASSNTITMRTIKNMRELGESVSVASTDLMGGWTEGPGLVKIRGDYYLTYTGLHYQTPGYQVCYSVAGELDKSSLQATADSFVHGAGNPMLLNCDREEGHVGNGHPTVFLGPDLDSWYIVYHNLDELYEDGMTPRSVNIDRLLVADGMMTGTPNKTGSVLPAQPRFCARGTQSGFSGTSQGFLSEAQSGDRFSAEFNSAGGDGVRYVFSWRGADDYAYVTVDYAAGEIRLVRVDGSGEHTLGTGTLRSGFSAEDMHTVRVAYDGELNVWFDNLCKISLSADLAGGRIGYFGAEGAEIGYTALSDRANGSSDREEIKQSHGEIPAAAYLTQDLIAPVGSYRLSQGSGVRAAQGSDEYRNASELMLASAYDYARYLVLFRESGQYGLELVLDKKYCGTTVCVQIDGGENMLLTVPGVGEAQGDHVRVLLRAFSVEAGVRQVKIQCVGQPFAFVAFTFCPLGEAQQFSEPLSAESGRVALVAGDWTYADGALQVSGERAFAAFTRQNVADFTISVDVSLVQQGAAMFSAPVGIIFRQDNYASEKVPGTTFTDGWCHVQGYYLQITAYELILSRYNFGKVKSYDLASVRLAAQTGTYYTYEVSMRGNTITVCRNGEKVLEVTDPLAFSTGALGLYSTGGAGSYKNLAVTVF